MKHTVAKCRCGNVMSITYVGPYCIIYSNCLVHSGKVQWMCGGHPWSYHTDRLDKEERVYVMFHKGIGTYPRRMSCIQCVTIKNFSDFKEMVL